jgi:hypothetical protein
VLGSFGSGPRPPAAAPQAQADTSGLPQPALPASTTARLVRSGPDTGLAVWVQDGHAVAASYAAASGWSQPQPLEQIYGQASDAQLASNGHGAAIALWRHTVGNIESLRFSRFDAATGWSEPDVMPGALPRPRPASAAPGREAAGAPRLRMDADGNAFAEWPSGFDAQATQTARYVAGQGWSRALSEPVASASPAARPSPAR